MGPARRATPYGESSAGAEDRYRPGEVIRERYHLVRPLGQGGFARVWVAHDSLLDTHAALKIIYLEPGAAPSQTERLLQEARAAARFRHPAIVRVFDFGQTERADPFVAMELLHGESLFELIQREGRLTGPRVVQLLLPIADALHTAHSAGIVHRDVKPENVFVASDELGRVQPKLLDFGIARQTDVDRRLTAKGAVVGTPDYMSPEQARGAEVDARTDIWSFSVMLYEALTGAVPFKADNYHALLNSIINDQPTPTVDLRAGNVELWRLLDRGLKKSPDDRWESMRAFGEALALWGYEHGTREDACGASLRSSWLEADFAEVKVEINSTTPPPDDQHTERPQETGNRDPRLTRQETVAAGAQRPKWVWMAAAAFILVVIAAGAFAVVRAPADEPGIEAVKAPDEPTPAIRTAPLESPTPPASTASAGSPRDPVAIKPPQATSGRGLAPTKSGQQPVQPAPAVRGAAAKPRSTASPDFGF
ncbi:MAG: protein kinase [Polyangiaceae bacterium]|nr:protein kinase [Polyangiaceae bacterium]MCE7889188.1 serine/threonine protein kinase [Sorangiineae bacterium PRO1]MCL4752418.1 protein kinase [Myxococcales bacterium]